MEAALALARRGLGRVWPNPAVGCVLVRPDLGGRVVGRGWTQPGGRPHAETEALGRAGGLARGATAYVTLEPCAHVGRTPPCADALVAAGIARAVVAVEDPDPRVSGRGLARLRDAGVAVEVGVGEAAAREVNAGFFLRINGGRPLVTVKVAATLDGRIATAAGESRWVTGDAARAFGHGLRARHDAIAIGIETALADDPDLRCRLPGLEGRSPVRIVFDSRLRLPPTSRMLATARQAETWILCCEKADSPARQALTAAGAVVIQVASGDDGRPDPAAAFAELARRGITRVLVEGGGRLAASIFRAGLADRLAWFRAPRVLGGDAVAAVSDLAIAALADAPSFERSGSLDLDADVVDLFRRKE
ncbi:MAG: bifunctional diaminohydroxyphosphoribosylaminopyrimidine deaminase/5-amino-6-(5-phosphoribosylamino)uracil reductase RibD [Rhodospirillales bacterium]|jgi:diaminohydroxyphosphoribosylaminopyrimidine deaminase/5-amino-6-(5-phosphoribosylamino)uracil reductase|nr:bifunctional diaminohydroxyphosphoribosylaminopyrimidine deaminase/5-amino-6-(5-phosphoribosylamino)uracil reductase RibD [Rhodospirillales bacterium]